MAIQRWRKLCSLVKNQNRSFRFTPKLSTRYEQEAAAISSTNQEKFRVAILVSQAAFRFINGIDGLDIDSQDKEQTERTEEANNIDSRYYCHQCDQLVTVPLDVNMTCPLCQGCFMEECSGAMGSESEPSARDSNGHGAMVIPSSNQTVLDIVENNNGSAPNRSPFHSLGSNDYDNYGETHQAAGHADSNLSQTHLLVIGSDHAVTSNSVSVPGHVVPYVSSSNSGSLPFNLVANVSPDHPHHRTRITSSIWIFSATGFGFEAVSAFFDQENFCVAILISQAAFRFINGIDGLDLDSQDREQTERTEEANNVGGRCYCHQCDQVVTVPVDVNMTCPLCQGRFMEECGGVSSLHLAMPSESGPSASDSDGHGAMVIPPSNQTVLDIVESNNGSALNRSPFDSRGSHDYKNYGETNQALGHYDSNPSESLLLGVFSDHDVTSNSVPGHVVPCVSSSTTGLPPLSLGANVGPDRPHHGTRITSSVWIFSATGLGFEAVSAFFDQVSTPRKTHYALYGMLLSIVAVLVCILDLILNAMKQRRITSESNRLWGILPEVFGLALACIQCFSSALQYSFLCRHAANPFESIPRAFLIFVRLVCFQI